MKMSRVSSYPIMIALLCSASSSFADQRNAPPPPPSAEDYSDSYGYADPNGAYPPQQQQRYAPGAPQGFDPAYDDERVNRHRENARVGGALIGAAGGAVAGSLIAGHGNRVAGGLIGGGVGALVGLGVGSAIAGRHRHRWDADGQDGRAPTMGYDYGVVDDTVVYHGHWVGSMTGSWNGGPVRTWQGTFDSSDGQTHWHGQYVDPQRAYPPQTGYRPMDYPAGRYRYGYRYAQPMYEEVFVPSQPIITKTIETHVSYVTVPVRARYVYKRVWRPAYHPVCSCAVPRPKPRRAPMRIMGS